MNSKIVLITGCSSGFGRLLVNAFLEKGWKVIATMRNAAERAGLFQAETTKYGAKLVILNFDVTSQKDLDLIVKHIQEKESEQLDCLINNAGFGVFSSLEDASPEQIQSQFAINVTGLILATRALLPYLRNSKGHIMNFSSVLGFSVLPLTSLYCSSKYAIEGFTESLYYELAPHGVRVSIVEPGAFSTDFKANVVYGEHSNSQSSPYFQQSQNYKKYTEDFIKKSGDPEVVVAAVLKAADSKNPPLRIRCGRDAAFVYLAKSLAPGPLFRGLNRAFFGMTINKKA